VKIRKGIDEDTLTYLDAGRIAQDEGVQWVALHGRTAAQMYGGAADWGAIARLKDALDVPVLGNGDIWTAGDALRLVEVTGCDGVVVGRGCLGRPWLFRDLAAAFAGEPVPTAPTLGEVAHVMRRHAELLVDTFDGDEDRACRDFRKHVSWYTKGFRVGGETRAALGMVSSLGELDALLGRLDPAEPYPTEISALPRGRSTGTRRVALPDGWLGDPDEDVVPHEAELAHSGG
jgi:nifR3 family TIM-barrel protein